LEWANHNIQCLNGGRYLVLRFTKRSSTMHSIRAERTIREDNVHVSARGGAELKPGWWPKPETAIVEGLESVTAPAEGL